MLGVSEPAQLPKAPLLADPPPPRVRVNAPLVVCLTGAAMGWALVAGCYALVEMNTVTSGVNPDAWGLLFGTLGLYASVPFAVVTTVLTMIFAFVRRVPPGVRIAVFFVLAPIEAPIGVLLLCAAVALSVRWWW
jgi:hypothetical protein